jgi:preprotein translocase subunit SecY
MRFPFDSRFVVIIFVAIVYRAGAQIPIPGFEAEALLKRLSRDDVAFETWCLFGYGVWPLTAAAVVEQFALMVAPKIRSLISGYGELRWAAPSLMLGIVAFRASSDAVDFEQIAGAHQYLIAAPGLLFWLEFIATVIGANAVLIALARLVARQGLVSGLLWLLFIQIAADLPSRAESFAPLIVRGQLQPGAVIGFFGLVLASTATLVFALKAKSASSTCKPPSEIDMVWPALLSQAIAAPLLAGCRSLTGAACEIAPSPLWSAELGVDSPTYVVLTAVLIFAFSIWRAVVFGQRASDVIPFVLAQIIVTLCIGLVYSRYMVPFFIDGVELSIVVVTCASLFGAPRGRQLSRVPAAS